MVFGYYTAITIDAGGLGAPVYALCVSLVCRISIKLYKYNNYIYAVLCVCSCIVLGGDDDGPWESGELDLLELPPTTVVALS